LVILLIYLGILFQLNPQPTAIATLKRDEPNICECPNIFISQTTIVFSEKQKNSTIEIIGRIRRTNKKLSLAGKEIKIDRGEMRSGIYFVRITDDKKTVVNRKILYSKSRG